MSKLVVNVGGMFSGKSTQLLRQGERHIRAKHNVVFIKPKTDNRYSDTEIVTHNGQSVVANVVNPKESIVKYAVDGTDVVLIDEVQFFDKRIVPSIWNLLAKGITVYASGLDMDFLGDGFETVNELMAVADEVNKLHAVCKGCGADAVMSAKKDFHSIDKSKERVELGADDVYMPLCRKCYIEYMVYGRENNA